MSNRKRIKKRPFNQVGPKNPSVEDMTHILQGSAGLFVMQYDHDDWCKAQSTQESDDCTCNADHRLMQFIADDKGPSDER